jgi:hypothetical protein
VTEVVEHLLSKQALSSSHSTAEGRKGGRDRGGREREREKAKERE